MQTQLKVIVTAVMIGTWGALMAVHAARAESQGGEASANYRLAVYQNGPGSAALLAGDTAAAIESAGKALRLPQPFAALVNLCAAHLMAGDPGAAQDYCLRAVEASRDGTVGTVGSSRREARDARALAIGNLEALRAYQRETGWTRNVAAVDSAR